MRLDNLDIGNVGAQDQVVHAAGRRGQPVGFFVNTGRHTLNVDRQPTVGIFHETTGAIANGLAADDEDEPGARCQAAPSMLAISRVFQTVRPRRETTIQQRGNWGCRQRRVIIEA
jgi:hypothetical protein